MYTIDDEKNDLYEEESYISNKWDNYKGIVFKLIIIILCIIVLIWLIKALNSNNNTRNNNSIHMANVTKLRLAAEDYFFTKNNTKTGNVTLNELKTAGLINELVGVNSKICDNNKTNVNLENELDTYVMKVNLYCGSKEKEEIFYYHRNTLACLNCNGITNMTGTKVVAKNNENNKSNSNRYPEYSCISWSDWSKTKVNDPMLTERKKVMVQGVKYGKKTLYGNWSEYSTTPVLNSDLIEVETKVEKVKNWSEIKTGTNIDTKNPNIRIISTNLFSSSNNQNGSYAVYSYQEYEEKNVTYYRYRIVSESKEKDVYTDKKYEENSLPSGYVKVKGTEEVYYSYKITNCEK